MVLIGKGAGLPMIGQQKTHFDDHEVAREAMMNKVDCNPALGVA